ncbi:MAG: DUF2490 domain-containing protein [Chitinophagaceae bacterium]|nr:DUF2490 domain-containing protein [Chitinophagaceae bacterium]
MHHNADAQSIRQHTSNINAWFMYFGDHKFNEKFGIHLEAQVRRNDGIANWQQLLLRTGINYHISQQVFFTFGYCFVETYPYGNFPVKVSYPEHRLWEQIQIKNQLGRFELVNRFRFEQRFSNLPVANTTTTLYEPGEAVYTNLFRLLNRVSVPLKGKTIQDKSWYLSAYDEIMVNAGKKVATNLLDQNRVYIAIGYKIPVVGRLEAGYLEQTVIKGDGLKIENNHTFQLGLASTLDFMKKKKR